MKRDPLIFLLITTVLPYSYFLHRHIALCSHPAFIITRSFFFSIHFFFFFNMALFLLLVLSSLIFPSSFAYWPPSPDYWPSSKFSSMSFYKGFRNLWGPQHQRDEQNALTIWLDSSSGFYLHIYPFFFFPFVNSEIPGLLIDSWQQEVGSNQWSLSGLAILEHPLNFNLVTLLES